MNYVTVYDSPLGKLTLASDGAALTGLWVTGKQYETRAHGPRTECGGLPVFVQTGAWLDRYFTGVNPGAPPPLAPEGSAFQQEVWAILCEIPFGTLTTYGAIAKRMAAGRGTPMAAQAVGGAVGSNPISIIIPCHRVVGTNGSLTGYGGGIDIKVRLLELEGVSMEGLYVPKKGTKL